MVLHRGLYFSTDLLLSSTYLRGQKPSWPQTVVTYEEHETGHLGRSGGHCTSAISKSWPSRPGEFHPEPLTEPCLTVSCHTARATQ